jgi:hypothetical protein
MDEVPAKVSCQHHNLFFGSGGYCIICAECSCMWLAFDPTANKPDINFKRSDLTNKDVRVNPNIQAIDKLVL